MLSSLHSSINSTDFAPHSGPSSLWMPSQILCNHSFCCQFYLHCIFSSTSMHIHSSFVNFLSTFNWLHCEVRPDQLNWLSTYRPQIWRRHGGKLPRCLPDWPQCLVNETVVFGQFGRALFHLQVTSNWRYGELMPFSDDEMTPCHILLSPTSVRVEFTCP